MVIKATTLVNILRHIDFNDLSMDFENNNSGEQAKDEYDSKL